MGGRVPLGLLNTKESYSSRNIETTYIRLSYIELPSLHLSPTYPGKQLHFPVTLSHDKLLEQLHDFRQFAPYFPSGQAEGRKHKLN